MNALQHVLQLIRGHDRHVSNRVDLVASNSWISRSARSAMSSSLPNNYCIGSPGNRLYGGCSYIDMLEQEVVELATRLFGMNHAVVQFLSGMQANIAAYHALLKPGDTVIAASTRHYAPIAAVRKLIIQLRAETGKSSLLIIALPSFRLGPSEPPTDIRGVWSPVPGPPPNESHAKKCASV